MRELSTFPLAFHCISPGPGWISRLEGTHTGGPFVSPDGQEAWKPLDCLPYPNAPHRVETREAEVLKLLVDQPGFPRNWRIEHANGRQWLVRKMAHVIPEDVDPALLTNGQILLIEEALRSLNSHSWTINDRVQVALDPDSYDPFLLDLSAAAPMHLADDSQRFAQWADEMGATDLIDFRRLAKQVVSSARWRREHPSYQWVYGSWYRPLGPGWPGRDIPDALYVDAKKAESDMHTWVVVPSQLSHELLSRYQLRWGWGPIVYRENKG